MKFAPGQWIVYSAIEVHPAYLAHYAKKGLKLHSPVQVLKTSAIYSSNGLVNVQIGDSAVNVADFNYSCVGFDKSLEDYL